MFIERNLFNLITNLIHCIISFCYSSVLYLFLYDSMYFSMSVWSLLPVDSALARDSGYAPLAAYRCVRRPWLVPAVWPLSDYSASEVGANSWCGTTGLASALLCGWLKGAGHAVHLTVFRRYARRSASTSRSARHLKIPPRYSLNPSNTNSLRHSIILIFIGYWYSFVLHCIFALGL